MFTGNERVFFKVKNCKWESGAQKWKFYSVFKKKNICMIILIFSALGSVDNTEKAIDENMYPN